MCAPAVGDLNDIHIHTMDYFQNRVDMDPDHVLVRPERATHTELKR